MKRALGIRTVVGAALTAIAIAASAPAQTETGRITGSVLNPAGEPVAGAVLVARSAQTGVTRKTKSSDHGTYAMPNLRAGVYDVTVEADGMERALLQVRVNVGTTSRLDFTIYPVQTQTPTP